MGTFSWMYCPVVLFSRLALGFRMVRFSELMKKGESRSDWKMCVDIVGEPNSPTICLKDKAFTVIPREEQVAKPTHHTVQKVTGGPHRSFTATVNQNHSHYVTCITFVL